MKIYLMKETARLVSLACLALTLASGFDPRNGLSNAMKSLFSVVQMAQDRSMSILGKKGYNRSPFRTSREIMFGLGSVLRHERLTPHCTNRWSISSLVSTGLLQATL